MNRVSDHTKLTPIIFNLNKIANGSNPIYSRLDTILTKFNKKLEGIATPRSCLLIQD